MYTDAELVLLLKNLNVSAESAKDELNNSLIIEPASAD